MEKTMYLSLFRDYELNGKKITMYRINKIDLYVLDIEGENPLFATFHQNAVEKIKQPVRFPGDFEMDVFYQGWYVFKSEELTRKLDLKSKTFKGYKETKNES